MVDIYSWLLPKKKSTAPENITEHLKATHYIGQPDENP